MCQVLVLTKNVLAEKKLQAQLQHLDHEVYCGQMLYSNLRNELAILRHFQCVIVSETFSHTESHEIISILQSQKTPPLILRKVVQEVLESDRNSEKSHSGVDLLSTEATLEELREKIDQFDASVFQEYEPIVPKTSSLEEKLKQVYLTNNERRFFEALIHQSTDFQPVSREKMAHEIWGKTSLTTAAQLSIIVQNIRRKYIKVGIEDIPIETVWGRGYQLGEVFQKKLSYLL